MKANQKTFPKSSLSACVSLVAFFLLLSMIGAYDFVMTLTHNSVYFDYLGYGERQIEYFTNYPTPLLILLTMAVWGTVIGAILLITRSRWSVYALAIALIGQVFLNIITFGLRNRWAVLGPKLGTQDLVILLFTLGALIYAISLNRKNIIH